MAMTATEQHPQRAAQAAAYRERARWRKAVRMAHLLASVAEPPPPEHLLVYGDDEWLLLQQRACPWLADSDKPPSDVTREITAAEYLRLCTEAAANKAAPERPFRGLEGDAP